MMNGRWSFQILFPFCGPSTDPTRVKRLLAFPLRVGQTEEKRGLTRLPNFLCVAKIYHIISHHITSSVFFWAILQAPAVDEQDKNDTAKRTTGCPVPEKLPRRKGWPTSTLRRGYRLPKWTDIHH